MNKVYKAAKQAYQAGKFTSFEVRSNKIDSSVEVWHSGKFICLFVSKLQADEEIQKQSLRAARFIG